uniref:MOSC domain-containing protein n=1 Tax=Ditylenchus dipsaci TaxID=166011 RepID=A0A915DTA4_9BILA
MKRRAELGRLTHLFLYPIKSCEAIEPAKWKLSATGLLYDRNWMIVSGGVTLTQKRFPVLCQIISEEFRLMKTEANWYCKIDQAIWNLCNTAKVCTNRFDLVDYDHKTNEWLSDLHPSFQNNDCHLVGKAVGNLPNPDSESLEPSRSFSNQGSIYS